MCHSTWGKASKCFVPGHLKEWEEGKRRGQGPHGVRRLAVTTCQALGLPCGRSMAERQVLLWQALCPGGQYSRGDGPAGCKRKVEAAYLGTAWSRCQAERVFHCSHEGPTVHPGDRRGGPPSWQERQVQGLGSYMNEEGWSACLSDAGPWVTHGWRKAVTEAAGKGTQDTSGGV